MYIICSAPRAQHASSDIQGPPESLGTNGQQKPRTCPTCVQVDDVPGVDCDNALDGADGWVAQGVDAHKAGIERKHAALPCAAHKSCRTLPPAGMARLGHRIAWTWGGISRPFASSTCKELRSNQRTSTVALDGTAPTSTANDLLAELWSTYTYDAMNHKCTPFQGGSLVQKT
jgi:hypothetical protein